MEDSDTFPSLEEERPEPERGEVRVRSAGRDTLSLPRPDDTTEGVAIPRRPECPVTPGWGSGWCSGLRFGHGVSRI